MKFKFNLKLTVFLVSLFVALLLVILGNKNTYCLSFGFITLGISLGLFIWYSNEKYETMLTNINSDIDEVDVSEEIEEEEKTYILQQLYIKQKKIKKTKQRIIICFALCAVSLIVLGIVAMF